MYVTIYTFKRKYIFPHCKNLKQPDILFLFISLLSPLKILPLLAYLTKQIVSSSSSSPSPKKIVASVSASSPQTTSSFHNSTTQRFLSFPLSFTQVVIQVKRKYAYFSLPKISHWLSFSTSNTTRQPISIPFPSYSHIIYLFFLPPLCSSVKFSVFFTQKIYTNNSTLYNCYVQTK